MRVLVRHCTWIILRKQGSLKIRTAFAVSWVTLTPALNKALQLLWRDHLSYQEPPNVSHQSLALRKVSGTGIASLRVKRRIYLHLSRIAVGWSQGHRFRVWSLGRRFKRNRAMGFSVKPEPDFLGLGCGVLGS